MIKPKLFKASSISSSYVGWVLESFPVCLLLDTLPPANGTFENTKRRGWSRDSDHCVVKKIFIAKSTETAENIDFGLGVWHPSDIRGEYIKTSKISSLKPLYVMKKMRQLNLGCEMMKKLWRHQEPVNWRFSNKTAG